jgi:hypothetical protein
VIPAKEGGVSVVVAGERTASIKAVAEALAFFRDVPKKRIF